MSGSPGSMSGFHVQAVMEEVMPVDVASGNASGVTLHDCRAIIVTGGRPTLMENAVVALPSASVFRLMGKSQRARLTLGGLTILPVLHSRMQTRCRSGWIVVGEHR